MDYDRSNSTSGQKDFKPSLLPAIGVATVLILALIAGITIAMHTSPTARKSTFVLFVSIPVCMLVPIVTFFVILVEISRSDEHTWTAEHTWIFLTAVLMIMIVITIILCATIVYRYFQPLRRNTKVCAGALWWPVKLIPFLSVSVVPLLVFLASFIRLAKTIRDKRYVWAAVLSVVIVTLAAGLGGFTLIWRFRRKLKRGTRAGKFKFYYHQ